MPARLPHGRCKNPAALSGKKAALKAKKATILAETTSNNQNPMIAQLEKDKKKDKKKKKKKTVPVPASVPASGPPKKKKKPHRFRPGTVALREIRKYQRGTELIIRPIHVIRVSKQIYAKNTTLPYLASKLRIPKITCEILTEGLQDFMLRKLEGSHLICLNGRRITVGPKDLQVQQKIHLSGTVYRGAGAYES